MTIPPGVLLVGLAKNAKHRKYLSIAIPFFLILLLKLMFTIDNIRSQPRTFLPDDYTFLHAKEESQKTIHLWIIEKNSDTPITVVMPWNEKDSRKANEANKSVSEGQMIKGKKKEKKEPGQDSDETGELMLYRFQLKDTYKK